MTEKRSSSKPPCPHLGLARLPGPIGAYGCVDPNCDLVLLIQNPIVISLKDLGTVGQQLIDGVDTMKMHHGVQRNLRNGLSPAGLAGDNGPALVLPFDKKGARG